MAGTYIVDVPAPRNQRVRYVVIAATATEAALTASRAEGQHRMAPLDESTFEVGRLGNFEPGLAGAVMTQTSSIVAVQRPAFD